ncbi:MAG TPA: PAS domain S-box protein [Verrucomicrobiae bacterium]|jgi:PAS domain S-box-containing protein|nr:PAS domain S-box protein [Verrucomicrobiae bacterium]
MKTKSPIRGQLQLAFGSAVLALLLVGAVSYRSLVESRESDRWVRHSHEVLESLQDLLAAMHTVESNARGYLLTGDESFLDAYRAGIARTEKDQTVVRNLTADNTAQQRRLDALATLAVQKFRLVEKVLGLQRTNGLEAATGAIQQGSGKQLMDDFQKVIGEMQDEELRLLALREADAKRRLAQTKIVLIVGTLLGLLITSVAGWSVQRDNSARAQAEEAMREGEERFRTLANNIPQLAWMADEKGYTFWYNDRWFDYTGTTLEEMAGWGWQKVHDPNHVKRVVEKISRCFQTGEVWDDTFPLRGRDGKYRLFLSRAVPIRDPNGRILRWFGTNTDISESKDSGAKYRGLLEAAPDAMVVVDQSGEIVLLNVQAEKQFGYSRDELLGQKVKNIIPEGFAERLIADGTRSAAEALAQQIGTGIELIARRKDGTEFPIEIMLSPLESAEGTLVTAAIRDISVRRAAEKHLAQMEGRYRGLLEAAPDAMVVVNPAGEIVLLNVQAEKQFGYQRDELVGQKVKNIIPEGFAERLIADGTRSAAEALAQQIGTGIELIGRRKNRSAFPIEIMLSPLESAEGTLVTAAIRDISVRKIAEKHLAQMEGRYRGLLEAAPDAMVVVNQSGAIVLLNVQAEKQFGYSRDELVGQKVKNIIPEGFAERLVSDALRSVEDALAQQIGTGIELNGKRKNGTEFPIEIMLSPLESAEGILVTAAVRDITARKQAEANLLNKVEELNRSNEELGQFAYIASHDLQEPLRMVASYTQLLSRRYKGKLDSDADEFIAFAVDGASRMQRLIQDLLAYSRVGTKGRDMVEVSSEEALQQALINLRGAIEEKGALVTHDSLPSVIADDMQLIQLFQNLVGNAIKYQSSDVPRVHITAVRSGANKWTFSVKDNGLGIDPQYFEKIFGMFQRLHKREEFAGTGIGLAICKKIVERHGGNISVESEPGRGSTFRFALAESQVKG